MLRFVLRVIFRERGSVFDVLEEVGIGRDGCWRE